MNDDYRVEKIETSVNILLDGVNQKMETYTIFLNKFSRIKRGAETVEELLESGKNMIPAKNNRTGEFLIINKNELIFMQETEVSVIQNKQNIVLILKNGYSLDVELVKHFHDARTRVLDYFNTDTKFLEFIYNDCKIYVNIDKVVMVKEQK